MAGPADDGADGRTDGRMGGRTDRDGRTDGRTGRDHYITGESHMWRKPGEAASPELAGGGQYAQQVPLNRAIPIWGGISPGGFATVVVHDTKKLSQEDWVKAVRAGKLTGAIKQLKPKLKTGPWRVLCDNERFMFAKASLKAYAARRIKLWPVPARSPDLNPIEKFWGWLRRQLRIKDLRDLQQKRPMLDKKAYTKRVLSFVRTQKAQAAAKKFAMSFRKTCAEVVRKNGAAARG